MFLGHPPFPCMFLQQGLREVDPFLVGFKVLCFHTFIWCNHGCTHLVSVSFFMKEFGSLTLMVALVEPPFGALLMAPNSSTMRFINLVVSWFCVMASFCWTTNTQKECIRAKNSLDNFSTHKI